MSDLSKKTNVLIEQMLCVRDGSDSLLQIKVSFFSFYVATFLEPQ